MVFADYNSFELTDENTRLDEWVNQLVTDQIVPRPGRAAHAG